MIHRTHTGPRNGRRRCYDRDTLGSRAWLIVGVVGAQLVVGSVGTARWGASAWAQPVPAPAPAPVEGGAEPDVAADAVATAVGPEQALTQKIAVLSLDALGMDEERVARLEALFRMELDRLASEPLPTRRDIDKAIASKKDLRNCSGDDKCVAAIGKQLGVEIVVTGSVGALGDSYVVNIKAVDVATAKQLRRIATDPLRGSPDELIEAVRVAAYRLLAPEQLKGSITVLTDLVGATVSVDGAPTGSTPLPGPISKLELGKHQLRVAADGYVPFEEEVDVRFQKSTRVVVRLAAEEPAGGIGVDPITRIVEHDAPTPWYSSTWFYVGVGVAAVVIGGVAGYAMGKDDVIDCGAQPEACR
jgi:hypothetical protein